MKKYHIPMPTPEEALEFRREQYGWTMTRMAFELGIKLSHYSEVISGKRRLPLEAIRQAVKIGVPSKVILQKFKSEKGKTP